MSADSSFIRVLVGLARPGSGADDRRSHRLIADRVPVRGSIHMDRDDAEWAADEEFPSICDTSYSVIHKRGISSLSISKVLL